MIPLDFLSMVNQWLSGMIQVQTNLGYIKEDNISVLENSPHFFGKHVRTCSMFGSDRNLTMMLVSLGNLHVGSEPPFRWWLNPSPVLIHSTLFASQLSNYFAIHSPIFAEIHNKFSLNIILINKSILVFADYPIKSCQIHSYLH